MKVVRKIKLIQNNNKFLPKFDDGGIQLDNALSLRKPGIQLNNAMPNVPGNTTTQNVKAVGKVGIDPGAALGVAGSLIQGIADPTNSSAQFLGGAATGAGAGAAAGTAILPGIGTAVGGIVGGLAGGISGIIGANSAEKAKKRQIQANIKSHSAQPITYDNGVNTNINQNNLAQQQYSKGGIHINPVNKGKFTATKKADNTKWVTEQELQQLRTNSKYPDGGTTDPAMIGMMKARMATSAEFGNTGSKRMTSYNPQTYTFNGTEQRADGSYVNAGETGTHFMGSMDNYAVPHIQNVNGKMTYMPNANSTSSEAIRFDRPQDAEYFAEHYKDIAPMMQNAKHWKHAEGGYMESPNAELQKSEVYRLPNGRIEKISDQAPTHAQGGVPLNLPQGTQMLGINPMFNSTFQKEGAKLKRMQDKVDKSLEDSSTTLTRTTAMRNMKNVQNNFNKLFSMQEMNKGIDTSYKYAEGGTQDTYMNPYYRFNQQHYGLFPSGGKIPQTTTSNAYMWNNADTTRGYGSQQMPGDSLKEKYFYDSPDSVMDYESYGNSYNANVYKPNQVPQSYDNQTPLPTDAIARMRGDMNNTKLKGINKFRQGGSIPKYSDAGEIPISQYNLRQQWEDAGNDPEAATSSFITTGEFKGTPIMRGAYGKYGPSADIMEKSWNSFKQPLAIKKSRKPTDADYQKFIDITEFPGKVKPSLADVKKVIENRRQGGGPGKDNWNTVQAWDKHWGNEPDVANTPGQSTTQSATQPQPTTTKDNGLNGLKPYDISKNPKYNSNGSFGFKGEGINPDVAYGKGTDAFGKTGADKTEDTGLTKWEKYGSAAAIAAPALYNIGRGIFGKADTMNPNDYRNKNEGEALDILRKRKANINIDPLLYENRVANRIGDENARNYSRGTGELLNRMQENTTIRNKSMADAYMNKYNQESQLNNQYAGDYANALNAAGANRANMGYQTDLYNKQSQSAKDNLIGTGLSQVQQGVQQYLTMQNQMKSDRLMNKIVGEGFKNYNVSLTNDNFTMTPKGMNTPNTNVSIQAPPVQQTGAPYNPFITNQKIKKPKPYQYDTEEGLQVHKHGGTILKKRRK